MADEDRTVVKTYVPKYQKTAWADHAEQLDMSQSEFVRTMVQAGRRDFDLHGGSGGGSGTPSSAADSGGERLEDRVLETLRSDGPLTWDDLLDRLAGNFEDRLEDALDELQGNDHVRYSGRDGGYVIQE